MMRLEGQGLHSGAPAVVSLVRTPGPLLFEVDGVCALRDRLRVVDSERSTTVATEDGLVRMATVEHLFAALAALRIDSDLRVVLEGPEIPLLDGGAAAFVEALVRFDIAPSPPRLVVARAGEVVVDTSTYRFAPGPSVEVQVDVDFGDPRLARHAAWDGTADGFSSVAKARTFGFEREVAALAARGLASHVSPESVVVIGEHRILSAGPPFSADEPARHKLLDLVGDLFLHGGPPRGLVLASRPGHRATHRAVAAALEAGLILPA